MTEHQVSMSAGMPSTVLPAIDPVLSGRISDVRGRPHGERRAAAADLVADHPRIPDVWALLGDVSTERVDRYAAYRVGYHRGLDALRANGWRGSGYVRWAHPSNRGFLRCLVGLRAMAAAIGERDEVERCGVFLAQLDPSGIPPEYDVEHG